MAVKGEIRQVLTANSLKDGLVVFMAEGYAWSPWIEDAIVAQTQQAASDLEARGTSAAKANSVVGPYLVDVIEDNGKPRAKHIREHLRTLGPSVRTDLGKQSQRESGGSGQGGAFI